MKRIIAAPLVAVALAGAGVGAYFAVAGAGSGEEAPPTQATATPTPSPAAQPSATPTPAPSPTPAAAETPAATAAPTDWLTYTDPEYGFSIAYPPDFIVEDVGAKGGLPGTAVKLLRAVDRRFRDGYPPGQVEFALFVKDADTAAEWVSKHSEQTAAPGTEPAYRSVTNVSTTTAGGREAVAFDWRAGEGTTIHAVALVYGSTVFKIQWYADDPAYEGTIRPVFDAMLASFSG